MECAIKIEINEEVSLFDEETLIVLSTNLSFALGLVNHALEELRGQETKEEPPKPIAEALGQAFKALPEPVPQEAPVKPKSCVTDALMAFAASQTEPWKLKQAAAACLGFSYAAVQSALFRVERSGMIEPVEGRRHRLVREKPVIEKVQEPTKVEAPAAGVKPEPSPASNGKYLVGYVLTGKEIEGEFTLQSLKEAMPFPHQAGDWIADWKARGWIETIRPMTYRKTEKFPTS